MSTAPKFISIKCHGEFYAREGQLKLLKRFEETVKAPSLGFFSQTNTRYTGTDDEGKLMFKDTAFINVRGVLKKKLLPIILQNKYQGQFVRVRGVTIDEIFAPEGEYLDLPINLMSIAQLAVLIKQRNMPLDPKSYINVDELRTDVVEYLEDPDVFKRNYERKSKKRAEEREFMSLNDLLPAQQDVPFAIPIPKSLQEAAQKVEKASKPKGITATATAQTAPEPY
jgi:hypothetical protein